MSGARTTTVAEMMVKKGPSTRAKLRVLSVDLVGELTSLPPQCAVAVVGAAVDGVENRIIGRTASGQRPKPISGGPLVIESLHFRSGVERRLRIAAHRRVKSSDDRVDVVVPQPRLAQGLVDGPDRRCSELFHG